MKSLRPFLPFLVLAFVIGVTLTALGSRQDIRNRAAPTTSVFLDPAAVTVTPGSDISLVIRADTGENSITAAVINVSFDPAVLEGKSIAAADFLPSILVAGKVERGKASITLGSPPTSPKKGTGILATLTLKAIGANGTSSKIVLDDTTQVASIGEKGNVVVGKSPATVSIRTLEDGQTIKVEQAGSSSLSPSTPGKKTESPTTFDCKNACGDGVCQKEQCGESAFTCSADCKASTSDSGGLQLVSEKVESAPAAPSSNWLVQLWQSFYGILKQ